MRHSPLRARLEERAGGRCEYCQAPQRVCGYRFHLEHIIRVALGGSDDESSRALACASCNLAKPVTPAGEPTRCPASFVCPMAPAPAGTRSLNRCTDLTCLLAQG